MRQLYLIFTIIVAQAAGWSINGHLYVTAIAERLLQQSCPNALFRAEAMLQSLTAYNSTLTQREVNHSLVESSTFADDWKYRGEAWQGKYHFTQVTWVEEDDTNEYKIKPPPQNLTDGSATIIAWLSRKQGRDHMDSHLYKYLMDKFENNEPVAESYALRLLIHIIGDITQPLHSMNRFSEDDPKGDKGANKFKLKRKYGVSHLHALWDKVLYSERKNYRRPIKDDDWEDIQQTISDLMTEHAEAVADSSVYTGYSTQSWTDEAFQIAQGLYDGLIEYKAVPQEYLDKFTPVAYERLVIGGYRLYSLLEYIFCY